MILNDMLLLFSVCWAKYTEMLYIALKEKLISLNIPEVARELSERRKLRASPAANLFSVLTFIIKQSPDC